VWGDPAYRTNAHRLQQAIAAAGGVARAAGIVEQAISTGQPVL
jgi:UDP:flavonoid glycosyltransferase YjiC (YdhE family)